MSSPDPKDYPRLRRERTVTEEGVVPIAPHLAPPSPVSTLNISTSSSGTTSSTRGIEFTSSSPTPASPRSTPLGGWRYYHGLPSKPILLASSRQVAQPTGTFDHPETQALFHVLRQHSLVPVWEAVALDVMNTIDRVSPAGGRYTIDPVRIGSSEGTSRTVIWIGTPPEAVTKEMAEEIIQGSLAACRRWNVVDINIEVKTTRSYRQALLMSPNTIPPTMVKLADPFCSTMGTPISCSETPIFVGTAAIAVEIAGRPTLSLLTCKHNLTQDFASEREIDSSDPAPAVHLHTQVTLDDSYNEIQSEADFYWSLIPPAQIDLAQAQISGVDVELYQDKLAALVDKRNLRLNLLASLNAQFPLVLPQDHHPPLVIPSPIIGKVLMHPPLVYGCRGPNIEPGRQGHTQDFAFVETEMTLANVPRVNAINLGDELELKLLVNAMPKCRPELHPKAAANRYLYSTAEYLSRSQLLDDPVAVLKRGHRTGLTVGFTNTLASKIRDINPVTEKETWSTEVGVIGWQKAFSDGGDSGSMVVTRDGTLVGLLTAGSPPYEARDISYVTPYFFLKERWEALGLVVTVPVSTYP
jgi:hypothetical protein